MRFEDRSQDEDWVPSAASVLVLVLAYVAVFVLPLTWGADWQIRYGRLLLLPLVVIWYAGLIGLRIRRLRRAGRARR